MGKATITIKFDEGFDGLGTQIKDVTFNSERPNAPNSQKKGCLPQGMEHCHKISVDTIRKQIKAQAINEKPSWLTKGHKLLFIRSEKEKAELRRQEICRNIGKYYRKACFDPSNIFIGSAQENNRKGKLVALLKPYYEKLQRAETIRWPIVIDLTRKVIYGKDLDGYSGLREQYGNKLVIKNKQEFEALYNEAQYHNPGPSRLLSINSAATLSPILNSPPSSTLNLIRKPSASINTPPDVYAALKSILAPHFSTPAAQQQWPLIIDLTTTPSDVNREAYQLVCKHYSKPSLEYKDRHELNQAYRQAIDKTKNASASIVSPIINSPAASSLSLKRKLPASEGTPPAPKHPRFGH